MSGAIEAVYIYDELNPNFPSRPLLSHVYKARPLSATNILQLYLAHPAPRPSLIYLPNTSPATLVFSLIHGNLLFLLTSSSEIEPLLALEFLHRLVDILEDFLGSPLISLKVESSYEVVAQLLNEMCDGGAVNTTEGNALRDLVEVEGWMGKFLGSINIPGKPGFASSTSNAGPSLVPSPANGPVVPWRRANVRHTSNEVYVDLVETLSVVVAPSGRPLAAFANGTIAFTSKISGVPDLLLSLTTPSGKQNINNVMELPVFHPCVRLGRWRERPGDLSFIPPDGRFVLAGYEVDLLPFTSGKSGSTSATNLNLPVQLEVKTGLGPTGADFEVKLFLSKVAGTSSGFSSSHPRGGGRLGSGIGGSGHHSSPTIEDLVVTVPIPADVRTITDIRASRGDTTYNPGATKLEWSVPARGANQGSATLRCTVVGTHAEVEENDNVNFVGAEYNYHENTYQSASTEDFKGANPLSESRDARLIAQNKILMPSSATLSFSIAGWLASGIKVDSLLVDTKKSRGLGEGVKPYKGVKYLTVSRGGVEVRC